MLHKLIESRPNKRNTPGTRDACVRYDEVGARYEEREIERGGVCGAVLGVDVCHANLRQPDTTHGESVVCVLRKECFSRSICLLDLTARGDARRIV